MDKANQRTLLLGLFVFLFITIGFFSYFGVSPALAFHEEESNIIVTGSFMTNPGILISAAVTQTREILSTSLQKAIGGGKAGTCIQKYL